MKTKMFVLCIVALMLYSGCASLMVRVNEQDEKTQEIKVPAGSEINVLFPVVKEGLETVIADAGYTNDSFKEEIRKELIKELTARGIKAVSSDKAENSYLRLNVTRIERGIGFFRLFTLFGLGDSFLTISVTLVTSEGKREFVAEKTGQLQGTSQMGDQTKDNIELVTTRIASVITK